MATQTKAALGAKFDFANVKGEVVDVPKGTRARKANKWLPLVAELRELNGKGKAFRGIPNSSDAEKEGLKKWIQNVQAAGRASDVTVRKMVFEEDNGTVTVIFSVVPAIKRTRGE